MKAYSLLEVVPSYHGIKMEVTENTWIKMITTFTSKCFNLKLKKLYTMPHNFCTLIYTSFLDITIYLCQHIQFSDDFIHLQY